MFFFVFVSHNVALKIIDEASGIYDFTRIYSNRQSFYSVIGFNSVSSFTKYLT